MFTFTLTFITYSSTLQEIKLLIYALFCTLQMYSINITVSDCVLVLMTEYNTLRKMSNLRLPAVVHFVSDGKPWVILALEYQGTLKLK